MYHIISYLCLFKFKQIQEIVYRLYSTLHLNPIHYILFQKQYMASSLQPSNKAQMQEAINEANNAVSLLLDTLHQIYQSHRIYFNLEKQYVHRIIMTLVAPVDTSIQYNFHKIQYFTAGPTPLVVNGFKQEGKQQLVDLINKNRQAKVSKGDTQQGMDQQGRPRMASILTQLNTKPQQSANYYQALDTQYNNSLKTIQKLYPQYPQKNSWAYPRSEKNQLNKHKLGLTPKIQQKISEWVIGQMQKGKKVTKQNLTDKALQISFDNYPEFKASRSWVRFYFKRYPFIKSYIMKCQYGRNFKITKDSSESEVEQYQSRNASESKMHKSEQEEEFEQRATSRVNFGFSQPRSLKKIDQTQQQQGKQGEKAIYDDGEETIIIDKRITNQITQSKYTKARRHRKSYANGNGLDFKNHSRFKDAYFSEMNKLQEEKNGVIVIPKNKKQLEVQQQRRKKIEKKLQKKITTNNNQSEQSKSKLKSYLSLMRSEVVRENTIRQ